MSDGKQLHRGPWGWGDGDPEARRIRAAYESREPVQADQSLSDRQRDVLTMLVVALGPLSARELFFLFDGVERTWIDHSDQGMRDALHKLRKRGLVERAGEEKQGGFVAQLWQARMPSLRHSDRRVRRVVI